MGESLAACTIECNEEGVIFGRSNTFNVVTAVINSREKASQVSLSVRGKSIFLKSSFFVPSLLKRSLRLVQFWMRQFFKFTLVHRDWCLDIWCHSLHTFDADNLSFVLKYLKTWSMAKYPELTVLWTWAKSKGTVSFFFLVKRPLALEALGPIGKSISFPSGDSSTSKLGKSSPATVGLSRIGNLEELLGSFFLDLIAPKTLNFVIQ